MKINDLIGWWASAVSVFVMIAPGSLYAATPAARAIPGITAKDVYPTACVDCHTRQRDGTDTRLSTLMARWNGQADAKKLAMMQAIAPKGATLKGKHISLASAVKDIPASCAKCHATLSKIAPPFAALVHVIHLSRGEESRFVTQYQGECTHCHKLNKSAGTWSVPSGAEK
jgi:hypothetical protein